MAVINSAIAIFNAIQSAIEYIRDLLEVLDRYVSTLAAVAAGNVVPGAQMLEQGLAAIIPIAIGFLANQVGLGNIPEKIVEIIGGLRSLVDQAIDWLIEQALRLGRAALDALGLGNQPSAAPTSPEAIEEPVPMADSTHQLRNDGPSGQLVLHSDPVLVSSIANPALQALVTQFNAATTMAARNPLAVAIAGWIAANMPATGPGGSAPNLGRIGRHGSQPPRLVDEGVPLWSLRSEHVVPYAVVSRLWVALGVEGLANRRQLGTHDRSLTTIMIYKGAGDAKDSGEGARRSSAAAHINALTATYEQRPDADTPPADAVFRNQVIAYLRGEQAWFASFTSQMVTGEHATASGTTTHGGLRNEAAAVPVAGDIASAAAQEVDDADRILDDALAESRP